MNQLQLTARLSELQTLRHSPAGVPVVKFKLHSTYNFQNKLTGQAVTRTVHTQISAVAYGVLAEQIAKLAFDLEYTFTGFLSSPRSSTKSSAVVFEVQSFQLS